MEVGSCVPLRTPRFSGPSGLEHSPVPVVSALPAVGLPLCNMSPKEMTPAEPKSAHGSLELATMSRNAYILADL